jgi:hypothetical protein
MAIITTNGTLGATAAITNTTLNTIADAATFASGAVDAASLEIISGGSDNGKLGIKDNGVTLAKMATQADQTVLGNVSGGTAVPTAVPIVGASGVLKNDDALGTSDTQGATQGNIKAYVDASSADGFTPTASASDTKSVTLPNGLIMKFGRVSASASGTTNVNFSDFGGNFTDVFSVVLTNEEASSTSSNPVRLNAQPTNSSFVIRNLLGSTTNVNFVAIGR